MRLPISFLLVIAVLSLLSITVFAIPLETIDRPLTTVPMEGRSSLKEMAIYFVRLNPGTNEYVPKNEPVDARHQLSVFVAPKRGQSGLYQFVHDRILRHQLTQDIIPRINEDAMYVGMFETSDPEQCFVNMGDLVILRVYYNNPIKDDLTYGDAVIKYARLLDQSGLDQWAMLKEKMVAARSQHRV